MSDFILGGGITGLATGIASGLPVFEAAETPGGICSSYYVCPGSKERLPQAPSNGEAYRFEIGGGHWIFGGDPTILRFMGELAPIKHYVRLSSVYFHEKNLYVPYPIQNFLQSLDAQTAAQALAEMASPFSASKTMEDWLKSSFGSTLCELFFYPFHELYTAGLYKKISPQDAYKSPVNLALAIRGALDKVPAVGYNATFIYPIEGLNIFAQRMAERCDLRYGKRVVKIDIQQKEVAFADGSSVSYKRLISTLPLNRMLEMTGLDIGVEPDPYTSVLVLNLGAVKGEFCPKDHWLYNPDAKSGFHRVGFYSNVDQSFLPKSAQEKSDRVSIYVERAYIGGMKPTETEIADYAQAVVKELQEWGYITEAEVVDPTWIDVAYTWAIPGSPWRQKSMTALEDIDIYPVGRYARWVFQGIADSIRDGFIAGSSLKNINS
jgi:protoporphyrinogen oxidase